MCHFVWHASVASQYDYPGVLTIFVVVAGTAAAAAVHGEELSTRMKKTSHCCVGLASLR